MRYAKDDLVLSAMAEWDHDGIRPWIAAREIAPSAGISVGEVAACLKRLERGGEVERRTGASNMRWWRRT